MRHLIFLLSVYELGSKFASLPCPCLEWFLHLEIRVVVVGLSRRL